MNKYQLIKLCFQQRCCNETDYLLSNLDCWHLTAKCVICILLNREATNDQYDQFQYNHINVATISVYTWNSYLNGPSGEIEYLAVGSDSWQYAVMNDGWP